VIAPTPVSPLSFDQALHRYEEAGVSGRAATGIGKFLTIIDDVRVDHAAPTAVVPAGRGDNGLTLASDAARGLVDGLTHAFSI